MGPTTLSLGNGTTITMMTHHWNKSWEHILQVVVAHGPQGWIQPQPNPAFSKGTEGSEDGRPYSEKALPSTKWTFGAS